MQNRIRKREMHEPFVLLRKDLGGDDESLPKSFSYNDGNSNNFLTNVFPITQKNTGSKIYQYAVDTNPVILKSKRLSNLIYSTFCPETENNIDNQKNSPVVFDGVNIIFSSLPNLEGETSVPDKKDKSKNIAISVKLIKEVASDDIKSLIHLYNIIFHRAYKYVGLTQFGKKWLNDQDIKQISNFKIIGGFKPSIIALSEGISFVVNNTYRIDRQGSLYDYLKRGINNQNERSDLINSLKEMQILTTHLKEQRLIKVSSIDWTSDPSQVSFDWTDKKTGQASKISIANYYQQVYNFTVQRDDPLIETSITINGEQRLDLFPASCLKITGITDAEKKNEQLMNEIYEATSAPIEIEKEKLDAFISKLKKNSQISSLFAKWGIEINDGLKVTGRVFEPPKIMFRTRQSDHAEVEIQADNNMRFEKELRNVGVTVPPRLNSVPLIIAPSSLNHDIKDKFIPTLIQISQEIGIRFHSPDLVDLENTNSNSYRKEILDYILKKGTPSFIIVIFPDVNKERYDIVKQLLTVELGIPSQFVKSSTLFSNKVSSDADSNYNLINSKIFSNICHKLLLQITAKTGGVCYHISPTTLPLLNTMIVGITIDKPSLNSNDPILCSMTASYDQTLARYYSDIYIIPKTSSKDKTDRIDRSSGISGSNSLIFNNGKDEIETVPPDFISDFIRRAVERYNKQRSYPPKRIIVYRGGATYNQLKKIKQEEVKAITDIIDPSTSLAYIIVQPHNNIKLMMINENNNPKSNQPLNSNENVNDTHIQNNGNSNEKHTLTCPKAGTIVTDKISGFGIPEFYIVSNDSSVPKNSDEESSSLFRFQHESLTNAELSAILSAENVNKLGMVTPTKYTIVHHFPHVWSDERLAIITHSLTCEYPNWQGAIKIPCPLMLASKLVEQSRTSLNSQRPNESLSDCLHFL